ncbi:TniB family NTP-binding protein [Deinococcus radiotolerans]|uniref:AAA+ ATPase domain-containing protein n=1 Tax=Deinococcus radiotolerans TaxID=1309407 RepID=A0ABQ2FP45_9DEIO|nr:TniB family NTP-binding protein [Deinococcus radiotolerans]GGL13158.1 hypothetical protein GCM10010844_34950 [Deinococcus radiotolerans]
MNLTEGAAQLVDAPAAQRVEYMRRRRRLHYAAGTAFLDRVQDLSHHQYAERSLGLVLTADQHQGKTTLLNWAFDRASASPAGQEQPAGQIRSIRVDVLPQWSLTSLYNACLEQLGMPVSTRGDPDQKLHALKRRIDACGTKLILMDEFHDVRQTAARHWPLILSGMRAICNTPGLTVVLAGLPEVEHIIESDLQLAARFEFHRLERWSNSQEYYNYLYSLLSDLPLAEPFPLLKHGPEVLKLGKYRLGHFSRIILEGACQNAWVGKPGLAIEDLREVAARYWHARR